MTQAIHILLRGPSGVGKSTLIQRLLAETGRHPGGFLTKKEAVEADGSPPGYIYPAACPEDSRQRSEANRVGRVAQQRRIDARPEVFDTLGCRYLEPSAGTDILLMDELGLLENRAALFQATVLACLDGDCPVLAAVKNRDTPFLTAVCTHPKALVLDVTETNREELYQQLRTRLT